jgi:hypothetical protein
MSLASAIVAFAIVDGLSDDEWDSGWPLPLVSEMVLVWP